jgi:hypothetical protein
LGEFIQHTAAAGTQTFWSPWYNNGGMKSMFKHGLYLTVTGRTGVAAPDGKSKTVGGLRVYVEDFLIPILEASEEPGPFDETNPIFAD